MSYLYEKFRTHNSDTVKDKSIINHWTKIKQYNR